MVSSDIEIPETSEFPPRLLIVDDDILICETMSEYLMQFDFECYTAFRAEDAFVILDGISIDVVITDIILPGMDGLELTHIVKKYYNSEVMVMTGYSGEYSYEDAVEKGASDFVFKPIRFEELLLRVRRVLKERRLALERARIMKQLEQLSITDGLTTLYNSRHFYNQLGMEIERTNRFWIPLSLLLIDIDYFKNYNDRFGHLCGDKVLVRFGQIIRSCLRKLDSAYRYGGEEFTAILPGTTGKDAVSVAQRIRRTVEREEFEPEKGCIQTITVSIGITEYRFNETIKAFIQRTDKAMYMSKQQGRNRITTLFLEDPSDSSRIYDNDCISFTTKSRTTSSNW